jgi:hypothetical protein
MTNAGIPYNEQAVTSLMKRIDTNKDGSIDFDEWCELLALAPEASTEAVFRYWADAAATGADDVILPAKPATSWKEVATVRTREVTLFLLFPLWFLLELTTLTSSLLLSFSICFREVLQVQLVVLLLHL